MYLIAGLGNPGKEYENTRHNMGFLVLDRLAELENISLSRLKHRALTGEGKIAGQRVMLVKPQTYMNNSGQSLGEIVRYYHIPMENLIVIYDDMDLPVGDIRIRKKGGPGTHNGMKSVVSHVGGEDFPRIRIGIGGSGPQDWKDFVLNRVDSGEADSLREAVDRAAESVRDILSLGIDTAMNRYNKRLKEKRDKS